MKEHSDSKNKYTEEDIIKMLEFLVDKIFVVFVGKVSQQIIGIPMGTKCAPLLADIFLYSYEAEFIQSLLSAGKKRLASQFNFTYRYIDDVLSINNPDFKNYLSQMYPPELEIKDTTESNTSASYLDLLLSIGSDGQLRTSLYEKKEEIWLSPMTKAPTPTEMSKGQSDNTKNATKKFDYTAVADRLRTVSWSNYSHPTGVVNRFTGPTSH